MNVEQAITFLNCTSINPDFDEFMLQSGIKKRPQGRDTLEYFRTEDKQVTLVFEAKCSVEETQLFSIIGRGKYVLTNIEVEPKNIGLLPYGISMNGTEKALSEKLGNPLKSLSTLENNISTYYFNKTIIVFFCSKKGAIEFIRFMAPTIYHVKQLGISAN